MATTVNISSYSGSVVGGDWTPAMAVAVDAIDATGGTINLDVDIELKTQLNIQPSGNYYSLVFKGDGGTKVTVNGPAGANLITLGNLQSVTFQDVIFIGETGTSQTADCNILIVSSYVEQLVIDRCLFAGIIATSDLIYLGAGNATITNVKFGGCGALHSHIRFLDSYGGLVQNCQFYDFHSYLTNYYDRQGPVGQWITVSNSTSNITWPAPAQQAGAQIGAVTIDTCRFDEKPAVHITVSDFPRVLIKDCSSNVSNVNGKGLVLDNAKYVEVVRYVAGYATDPQPSMVITDCEYVMVDGLLVRNGIKEIDVDATTKLTVRNSPEAVIDRP